MTAALLLWLLAAPAEAASCDGPACMVIRLDQVGACVWVRSSSRERVDVEARLPQGAVTLALEPADPKKADAQAAAAKAGQGGGAQGGDRRCQRALASEQMLNDQRRQGRSIPYNPQIDGVAAECRRAAAVAAKPVTGNGEHTYVFDPMFPQSKGTPLYRAPLLRGGSCVARLEDVQGCESIKLHTFHSCLKPKDITRHEVNFIE